MTDVDAFLADPDVPRWEQRIPVDGASLERIRATLDRGADCWVSAVVVDDAGRVLLVRNRWSDGWTPPGGTVESGEAPRAAAEREVREETGVAASVGAPVAVVAETFACEGATASGHRIAFTATADATALADDPGLEGEGIADVGWFEELPPRMEGRRIVERGLERL